jgi:hypothetical protein
MRGQRLKVVLAVCAAMLVSAPVAMASSPSDIYRDLADNGELNSSYSKAEMQAFLKDAPVQGYGNAVVDPSTPTPSAGGVAGETTDPVPATETAATVEALPFTGAELGVLALVGAALLVGGFLLRASARTT